MMHSRPIPATSVAAKKGRSNYPEPFAGLVRGRLKRKLGEAFDLNRFGVNLTQLDPGSASALLHRHSKQDEFIYVLEGRPTLVLGDEQIEMRAGDCVGFKGGNGVAHQLVNRSNAPVLYLEIGDRSPDDEVEYPDDDLKAVLSPKGNWLFTHKDGSPY